MNETILGILVFIVLIIFFFINQNEITYHKSSINNKFYLVRNLDDKQTSSNIISKIDNDLKRLVIQVYKECLKSDINKDKDMLRYIKRIVERIDNINYRETSPYSRHTSYSVNKGEEIVLCIRSKKTGKLHDYNTILYVAIHEIAHVGCTEIGHTKLFFDINKYLLGKAIKYNIYKMDNYQRSPVSYCGITIKNNILA